MSTLGSQNNAGQAFAAALDAACAVLPDVDRDRVEHALKAAQAADVFESGRRFDAVLKLTLSGAVLLDPRAVAAAIGHPHPCTCPGGETNWRDDFDWDCPRHQTPDLTHAELRALLNLARPATTWAQGGMVAVYHDDPGKTHHDGLICNVLSAVVAGLRPGDPL